MPSALSLYVEVPQGDEVGSTAMDTLTLSLRKETRVKDILMGLASGLEIPQEELRISTFGGLPLEDEGLPKAETGGAGWARIQIRGCGGKGGFGSQLRAQGGRMATRKTTNFSSCRDLSGRRLKVVAMTRQLDSVRTSLRKQERDRRDRLQKKVERAIRAAEAASKAKEKFADTAFLQQGEEVVEEIQQVVKDQVERSMKRQEKKDKGKGKALGFGAMWGDEDEESVGTDEDEDE
ncbi:telomere stability and silencing-domain-containing protein [Piptocephalis cylindrospora]|uniref:Telomere stability and silencing-domain-containing protein n=1 Tax=Piptocephalis cylindrospora TaxID=1907219 RepID=A0A4P9Y6J5_9FUNG|nr:telomere stability and silencing-domain-containing protein [Piptocephalis cylindrospora]|eukprot:RKP13470.1 telomere stability and silencing-domain-containing protein [Piptocephalis cylindrospora]